MKPIEKLASVNAYMLIKLDSSGKFQLEASAVTEQGDYGLGFYSDLSKAQYQQTILALKGIQVQIYHIEHPL